MKLHLHPGRHFAYAKERLSRYKDKIEITGVTLAANVPTFLLSVYYKWYIWMPATLAIYGLAASYPFLLKSVARSQLDSVRQKEREAFALGEFGAGIPAALGFYGTFNALSNGGTANHILTVCGMWITARAVGVPTWIYLWKKDNPTMYARTGWKTSSLMTSFVHGIRRKYSTVREGAANELLEQWGYGRSIDWPFILLSTPILMETILQSGFRGPDAFALYGVAHEILTDLYYPFYFSPRFYSEMTTRLLSKKE